MKRKILWIGLLCIIFFISIYSIYGIRQVVELRVAGREMIALIDDFMLHNGQENDFADKGQAIYHESIKGKILLTIKSVHIQDAMMDAIMILFSNMEDMVPKSYEFEKAGKKRNELAKLVGIEPINVIFCPREEGVLLD